jgi:hypothetical protein
MSQATRGRCHDHNFQRFFPIFGKKLTFFLNTNVMINFFLKFSFVLSQERQFFAEKFRQKYFKIITSVPGANHNASVVLG